MWILFFVFAGILIGYIIYDQIEAKRQDGINDDFESRISKIEDGRIITKDEPENTCFGDWRNSGRDS